MRGREGVVKQILEGKGQKQKGGVSVARASGLRELLIVAACQKLGLKKLQIHIVVNGMFFVLEEKSADLLGSSTRQVDNGNPHSWEVSLRSDSLLRSIEKII